LSVDRRVAGLAELPRRNGELVFEAPWEGRAFGLAVTLSEGGLFAWDAFRERLVAEVADGRGTYYEQWLRALQAVLLEAGVVGRQELVRRVAEFSSGLREEAF